MLWFSLAFFFFSFSIPTHALVFLLILPFSAISSCSYLFKFIRVSIDICQGSLSAFSLFSKHPNVWMVHKEFKRHLIHTASSLDYLCLWKGGKVEFEKTFNISQLQGFSTKDLGHLLSNEIPWMGFITIFLHITKTHIFYSLFRSFQLHSYVAFSISSFDVFLLELMDISLSLIKRN